jgi:hypothetical protein
MTRLTKRDVEQLWAAYDADPVGALRRALARVLDRPAAAWPELLAAAPLPGPRREALAAADPVALDALARELNELRGLEGSSEH